ncbi:MAG TPA: DUF1501 domain-containing protein [Kofleriaceae bacterium]|nr:DUF1501 domain-containing protein [Kofleriaceae bacterium]
MKRRTFLHVLGGSAAAVALRKPLWAAANSPAASDDFFIFIHAAGGWDVTLWSDPRNERRGLVEPASSENTDTAPLTHWKGTKLDGDVDTFEILAPRDVPMRFGPGIGALYDLRSRLTVVNGLAMATVSHPDGTAFSATGRHLQGGRAPASSVDVAIANELGTSQLLPDVAVQFPSSYVGDHLDRRAVPLRVANAATVAKSLARGEAYFDPSDRTAITALVTAEAHALAKRSTFPETYERIASQTGAVQQLLDDKLEAAFTQKALQERYPQFDYKAKNFGGAALGAAFTVEAMQRNLVRCVGFAIGGFDTHNQNYKQQAHTQQELFGVVATLVDLLDRTPHPTRQGKKLADHAHILVFSDFCRTPQINLSGGRDHYPNNSALVISPRFVAGRTFGKTDVEQVLPADAGVAFAGGARPLAPPDLLATFLHAFDIDPARYLRDGEVVQEMLA